MNQIRAIQALNKREIENGVPPEASWHTDYRDTAFVNFGGLPYSLSEGDIITIFSQYGEPVFLKLARDKETGRSKGFGWLKYEDQRSTDLAVDNLGGAEIGGRLVRVDHARYKARDDEDAEEFRVGWEDMVRRGKAARGEDVDMEEEGSSEGEEEVEARPLIREERELARLLEEHDDDDPMKGFLIEEKRKEVELALRKDEERRPGKDRKDKHRHHHHRSHRSHRSRRDERDSEEHDRHRRSRRDETPVADGRDRDATPERKRGESRDRERKRQDDSRDLRRDRGRDRDRDDRDDYKRRHRHYEDEDEEERVKDRKSRRRSRSRSPRSYRD
ncbi:hypothetical protein F5B20DRAFT_268423 [Whalleya microplaca]|nr:hypothetical protein F5B20DRAFT_268423 [Whalleya microplaca]